MYIVLIQGTRFVLILLWTAAILSLFSIFSANWNVIFLSIAATVLCIHVLEYLLVKAKTGRAISLFWTLFYGYGYWLPLFKEGGK